MLTEEMLLGAIFDVTNPKKVHDFLQFTEGNHERLFRTDVVETCTLRRVARITSVVFENFVAQYFGTPKLNSVNQRWDTLSEALS
jgi:hypothetical protein